jgi:hypothetical protein
LRQQCVNIGKVIVGRIVLVRLGPSSEIDGWLVTDAAKGNIGPAKLGRFRGQANSVYPAARIPSLMARLMRFHIDENVRYSPAPNRNRSRFETTDKV